MSIPDVDRLRLLPLSVRATMLEPLEWGGFPGSALRGAFGHALKDTACVVEHRECEACDLRGACAVPALFEPPPPPDARRLAGQARVPPPYVLRPPPAAALDAGDPLEFGVTLIGRARDALAVVVGALARTGGRGLTGTRSRFEVGAVEGPGGAPALVGDPARVADLSPVGVAAFGVGLASGRARIDFESPVRLTKDGRPARSVTFPLLVRALLWRASTLLEFHEGIDLDLDYRGWIDRAAAVRTVASDFARADSVRWSSRQDRVMNLRGVRGHLEVEGDLQPFEPLLALGAAVGVGKGTTFGLGRMSVRSGPGEE